jgi:NO-binding membrane sensor protein with MHYT domain
MSTITDGRYQMEFDPIPIVLSCAISFLGSYAAVTTFEQFRLCKFMSLSPKLFSSHMELVLIAVILGGVSIWTMHFVGMSSCVLRYPGSELISPIFYRIDFTMASLVAVIVLVYVGKELSRCG